MSFLRNIVQQYAKRLNLSAEGSDRGVQRAFFFVFPNRRAAMFFRRYLASAAGRAILSPQIITIQQLFEQLSPLKPVEQTELLFRLYRVYREIYLIPRGVDESFDNFVFWGRMMLSDFNEVDMNLVDASRLFQNLADLKDIEERFSGLGEEQRDSLKLFASGFRSGNDNVYREKFVNFWQTLLPVYKGLRTQLLSEKLAYTGMLQREVVEKHAPKLISEMQSNGNRFVFIGFNALTASEKRLMLILRDAGIVEFCWDYGHKYLCDPKNLASLFMQENLKLFPQTIVIPSDSDKSAAIHLVKIPSAAGEAQMTGRLLEEMALRSDSAEDVEWMQTGVILPDERMLNMVQRCIPPCVTDMNITMGQSLAQTPVMSLLQHLGELQMLQKKQKDVTFFYYRPVHAIMCHPYIAGRLTTEESSVLTEMKRSNMTFVPQTCFANSRLLSLIFTTQSDIASTISWLHQILLTILSPLTSNTSPLTPQHSEYICQTLMQLNRLKTLTERYGDIDLSLKTFFQLLTNLVAALRVPFEGEPLAGLQIMGMLESRGMDFKHVILTDVNDDVLPGRRQQQTYIPNDLRNAYGLPTPERQDAVFAYNFYRLIAHADEVWLLQNTASDDMRSGEESRYVTQLRYEYGVDIDVSIVTGKPETAREELKQVQKDANVMQELSAFIHNIQPIGDNIESPLRPSHSLSPSALNTYVQCPLKFYLQYVHSLREAPKIDEGIRDDSFGNVLHNVMQELYQPYRNSVLREEYLVHMKRRVHQTDLVERLYMREQYHTEDVSLDGKDNLAVYVIKQYVTKVLDYDLTLLPFRYIDSEVSCETYFQFTSLPVRQISIKGVIDRIDEKDGVIRIIDYKTGSMHNTFPSMSEMFSPSYALKSDHVRQTLLYCLLYANNSHGNTTVIEPHVYYVRKHGAEIDVKIEPPKSVSEPARGFQGVRDDFEKALRGVLDDIFNSPNPFSGNISELCDYCPFSAVCNMK